jgi:hypothetical protein
MLVFSACPKTECCIAFRQSLIIQGIKGSFQRAFYTKPLLNNRQFHPAACSENSQNPSLHLMGHRTHGCLSVCSVWSVSKIVAGHFHAPWVRQSVHERLLTKGQPSSCSENSHLRAITRNWRPNSRHRKGKARYSFAKTRGYRRPDAMV